MRYLFAVLLALPFCLSVHAETITDLITFQTSNGYSGSFTLTFDPTISYPNDTTTGLVVNSMSAPDLLVPSGFIYSNTGDLTIGGLAIDVQWMQLGTNDYSLAISGMGTSSPSLQWFDATSTGSLDLSSAITGSVTVTQLATTPEPSSFMLLGTGLLGVAGVVKRRLA